MPTTVSAEGLHRFEFNPMASVGRNALGVEIFRAGEWNGDKYSIEDIDEMVNAFGAQGYAVPLKFGHQEVPGGQAYGWVSNVYRVGDVMKADFKDIPEYVFDWVFLQHAYDAVSIEIYFNLKRNGKVFKRALKAVALLGSETPAVSGLAPLREAIFANGEGFEKIALHNLKVANMPDPVKPEENTAVANLTASLSDANKTIATLRSELNDTVGKLTALTSSFASLAAERVTASIDAKVEACKVPALREHLRHIYSAAMSATDVVKFSENGTQVEKSLSDVVDGIVEHINKFADTLTAPANITRNHKRSSAATGEDPTSELATKTSAYLTEHKLPIAKYGEAMRAVLAADADLRKRYNDFTGGQA